MVMRQYSVSGCLIVYWSSEFQMRSPVDSGCGSSPEIAMRTRSTSPAAGLVLCNYTKDRVSSIETDDGSCGDSDVFNTNDLYSYADEDNSSVAPCSICRNDSVVTWSHVHVNTNELNTGFNETISSKV